MKRRIPGIIISLSLTLSPGVAGAAGLDFTVAGDVVHAPPGAVVLVSAIITNPAAEVVYINGITSGVTPDYAGDDVFEPFEEFGPGRLGPGESWEGPILRLTLSPSLAPAVESFDVVLSGGGHAYAAEPVGFTYFAVDDSTLSAVDPVGGPAVSALRAVPNPFRSELSIDFTTGSAGRFDVSVFDVSGRRVARLFSDDLPAGPHRFRWDGRDHTGAPVSSGVFFIRVLTEDRTLKTKVLKLD